jgi:ABC-type branched-subunit amino acid transport system ATPase component
VTADALLDVAAVSKRFSGLAAVDDVSLRVARAEIRGIVGPNGAGKTTLFNLVSGLYAVSGGRIRFRGHDVTRAAPHARARLGLGRTYQTPQIFPDLPVFDNVAVGLACRRAPTAREALFGRRRARVAAVHAVTEALAAAGLDVDLGRPAGTLAFGEQKRLEIARALAGDPALLLMDEPAAGLTRAEIEALVGLVRTIRDRGVTVALIEHNMRVVMGLCDRVTVLDFGCTLAEGTPDEVRRDPRVVAAYLGGGRHAGV